MMTWDQKGRISYFTVRRRANCNKRITDFFVDLDLSKQVVNRNYQDLIEEHIIMHENDFKVHVVGSEKYIHLIIISKPEKMKSIRMKIERHFPE